MMLVMVRKWEEINCLNQMALYTRNRKNIRYFFTFFFAYLRCNLSTECNGFRLHFDAQSDADTLIMSNIITSCTINNGAY